MSCAPYIGIVGQQSHHLRHSFALQMARLVPFFAMKHCFLILCFFSNLKITCRPRSCRLARPYLCTHSNLLSFGLRASPINLLTRYYHFYRIRHYNSLFGLHYNNFLMVDYNFDFLFHVPCCWTSSLSETKVGSSSCSVPADDPLPSTLYLIAFVQIKKLRNYDNFQIPVPYKLTK